MFKKELAYFKEIKEDLLKHHKNKHALIKGDKLINTFTTPQEAYAEGIKKFGAVPFLIKQIAEGEPSPASLPALTIGIIHANP